MGAITFKPQDTSSSTLHHVSHVVGAVANHVSNAYAFAVSQLSSWMRPQAESPAESAQRLRTLAELYADHQPSYAADLRAAADQHNA